MRISDSNVKELQKLLKTETGEDYSLEIANSIGTKIVRIVIAKALKEVHREE